MQLQIFLPTEIFLDTEVRRVVVETANGAWCLLPRHVDFVALLVPGLLTFVPTAGQQTWLAVDEGTLVKCGPQVLVSTRYAVRGGDLGQLKRTVVEQFQHLDEREALARAVLAKLEADTVRRFAKMGVENV